MKTAKGELLFIEISRLLHRQPVDDVMPVLITAVARAIVIDAQGDIDKLDQSFTKFVRLTQGQIGDMINQDMDEAREATKQ